LCFSYYIDCHEFISARCVILYREFGYDEFRSVSLLPSLRAAPLPMTLPYVI